MGRQRFYKVTTARNKVHADKFKLQRSWPAVARTRGASASALRAANLRLLSIATPSMRGRRRTRRVYARANLEAFVAETPTRCSTAWSQSVHVRQSVHKARGDAKAAGVNSPADADDEQGRDLEEIA
mmetsp:Transcript_294/g.861  ORF Transcript_294/g.861 Transcript_294/m.861 type:complete len:127 (-) Transcript_294:376-756(-)